MNEMAQYFDARADDWERNFNRPSPVQGAVAAMAGVKAGSRVLDLGCGTGIMAPVYLDCKVGGVVALDVAPRMIEIAQEKFRDEPRLDFRCCDALAFEDEGGDGFDAVVVYNAYPHFLDKPALVKKAASLLRPNGRFVVAHSRGRENMNRHHGNVPASVRSELLPAAQEARAWESLFEIDAVVDAPSFYAFSGLARSTK